MHVDVHCYGLVLVRFRESSVERLTMATMSHESEVVDRSGQDR